MHASAPVIAIWDDHEIANNPWMNGAEDHQAWEGDFHVRAGAAIRAFHEWLPTREPKPNGDSSGDASGGESSLEPTSSVANNSVSQGGPKVGAGSSFPKKVAVSKKNYTTKSEHDDAVERERTAAFERLKFMRAERDAQASNPSAPGYVNPSEGEGVVAASPAAATRRDLLTLEERVTRVERILNSNNLTEEQWLNEG